MRRRRSSRPRRIGIHVAAQILDAPARFLQATIGRGLDAGPDRPALCKNLIARRLCQGAESCRDIPRESGTRAHFRDGLGRVPTPEEDYDIDTYLAEINVVVDDLRTLVHGRRLVPGRVDVAWMHPLRCPDKIRSTRAGSYRSITTPATWPDQTTGAPTAHCSAYRDLVAAGGGRMWAGPRSSAGRTCTPASSI